MSLELYLRHLFELWNSADGKSFNWPHEVVAAPPGWTTVLKTCIRYCGAVFDHVVEAQHQGADVERGQPAADLVRRARYTAATPAGPCRPTSLLGEMAQQMRKKVSDKSLLWVDSAFKDVIMKIPVS